MAINLNVGILGHVDSGKTSLTKALSQVASTASFDKNPQSQERGITLDLGFSSFVVEMPERLKDEAKEAFLQFTLVDCPGHASLIKTIMGGAQIIDMMLLVIDITKGVQAQTAECLIIGEITCRKMIVVLNKTDLLPSEERTKLIEKKSRKLATALATSCFKDAPMVSTSASPSEGEPTGIKNLIEAMNNFAFLPRRSSEGPFLFSVDHCFAIKGQGTVMTGTVLQGQVKLNDIVDVPSLGISKKVKSMQIFRKTVTSAQQGDRLGICVTQFDPKLLERGIICSSNFARIAYAAIIYVNRIKFFRSNISSKSKFHITIGYETSLATITIFSASDKTFSFQSEFNYCKDLGDDENLKYYMLIEFEKPVLIVPNSLVIGSKLDIDIHANICRLAFWGKLLDFSSDKNYRNSYLQNLKICKTKSKHGTVERVVNNSEVIVKNMFKKESDISSYLGLNVHLSTGEKGVISSSFGQSGKVKVFIPNDLTSKTLDILKRKAKKGHKLEEDNTEVEHVENVKVFLEFKRCIYNNNKSDLRAS